METLGTKLRKLRDQNGLKQINVARNLQIGNKTLSDYERDRSEPDINTLLKISKYYKVSTDFLIGNNLYVQTEFQLTLYKEVENLTESQKQDLLEMVKLFKKQSK